MTAPLKPITGPQLKALHAIGRRRGWDHQELRRLAGVRESLKELSVIEAGRLIDRLQTEEHKKDWTPPPPDRARRGTIRLATERQRNMIVGLFADLGWDAAKAGAWLKSRHGITDLANGTFSSAAAVPVINELNAMNRSRQLKVSRELSEAASMADRESF
jgi:hypothetical protein